LKHEYGHCLILVPCIVSRVLYQQTTETILNIKKMKGTLLVIVIMLALATNSSAQPSKTYLMSFFTCSTCGVLDSHRVQLAESNNGYDWSLVPGFSSFKGGGSVPDVITRSNMLYLYTTSGVKKYNYTTNAWDTGMSRVTVQDSSGTKYNYVDPSMTIDSSGKLVMFFLDATGSTGDPASCGGSSSCTKYFRSAVESGTDGTSFILRSGARLSYSLTTSSSTASDPDIYFDGSQYILYISTGASTRAYKSSTLHGSYTAFSGLSSALLTNSGGIPSGYYDADSSKYWTLVHTSTGRIQIKKHSGFTAAISSFTTVVDYNTAGLSSSYFAESPGICKNTLSISALPISLLKFEGEEVKGNVNLQWQVGQESLVLKYEVAREMNGSFVKVGEMVAQGSLSGAVTYKFSEPTPAGERNAYYRLRIVNADGSFQHSEVINVGFASSSLHVSVMQNPFENELSIAAESAVEGDAEVCINDISGRFVLKIKQHLYLGVQYIKFEIPKDWPMGMYWLSVNGIFRQKLIRLSNME
jgi:hypothetical protein